MRNGKVYNLLDIRECERVIENGQARDIKEFVQMPELDVSYAHRMGRILLGRYVVELSGPESRMSPERRAKKEIPDELLDEWRNITAYLRDRIIWVKKEDAKCLENIRKLDPFI